MVVNACKFLEKRGAKPGAIMEKKALDALADFRSEGAGRGRGQVAPLKGEHVERMAIRSDEMLDTLAGARDAALFRLMSDCLLRVSEAVAVDCEHISFDDEDGTEYRYRQQWEAKPPG